MSSLLLSHLPVISCTLCYVWSAILNTVSLHPTVVDYCTVRYGTGEVVQASVCTVLNSGDPDVFEHAARTSGSDATQTAIQKGHGGCGSEHDASVYRLRATVFPAPTIQGKQT